MSDPVDTKFSHNRQGIIYNLLEFFFKISEIRVYILDESHPLDGR